MKLPIRIAQHRLLVALMTSGLIPGCMTQQAGTERRPPTEAGSPSPAQDQGKEGPNARPDAGGVSPDGFSLGIRFISATETTGGNTQPHNFGTFSWNKCDFNGAFGTYYLALQFADSAPPNRHQQISIDLAGANAPKAGSRFTLSANNEDHKPSISYTRIDKDEGEDGGFEGRGSPDSAPTDCDLTFSRVETLGVNHIAETEFIGAYDDTQYGFEAALNCRRLYKTQTDFFTFEASIGCKGIRRDFAVLPPEGITDQTTGKPWRYQGVFARSEANCTSAGEGYRFPTETEAKAFAPVLRAAELGRKLNKAAVFSFWVSGGDGTRSCSFDPDPSCLGNESAHKQALVCVHD